MREKRHGRPRTAVSNPPIAATRLRFGEKDLIRRSASTRDAAGRAPDARSPSSSTSRSASAARPASRPASSGTTRIRPIGDNVGVYDNPHDLTPDMFTLMRFTEWENPATGNLEWLIRKDGCMHCEDPGCLKACPAPGAIVQYSNGIVDFIHENCIGCGYCIKGCPFNIPRISKVDHKAYKCTLCSDRVAVGQGPACAKACPTQAIVFGTKDEMKEHAGGPHRGPEVARLRERRPLRSAGRRRHARHVRAAPRRQAGDLCRACRQPEHQPAGAGLEGRHEVCRLRRHRLRGGRRRACTLVSGANRVTPEDEEKAEKLTRGGGPARRPMRAPRYAL